MKGFALLFLGRRSQFLIFLFWQCEIEQLIAEVHQVLIFLVGLCIIMGHDESMNSVKLRVPKSPLLWESAALLVYSRVILIVNDECLNLIRQPELRIRL